MPTYRQNSNARCPHCLIAVRFVPTSAPVHAQWVKGPEEELVLFGACCPQCGKVVVTMGPGANEQHTVWPLQSTRPIPGAVPKLIAAVYREAAVVLSLSPMASAAFSRRCLETVLVEAGGATEFLLSKKIDEVKPNLPAYIAESIDAIRNIGNFAAHPMKDENTGNVVDVEPGEAEWNLEVLDMLFDHYYVKPVQTRQRRDALDAKLKAAGKLPMK